ncbi:MAG: acyl-CoA dehydrogenase family protein [Alphaproteobacteria bacterium]|nr:acyl-CoA dehydrogenase family protein [Alphaproteobacteria bacterium]
MNSSEDSAEAIRMLRESAAAIVPPGGDLGRVRALRFKEPGYDPAMWRRMAALGWFALRLPEAQGGAGLGVAALAALAEELGRGLVPEPLVAGAILPAALIAAADEPGRAAALLPALLSGARTHAFAWQEAAASLDIARADTIAEARPGGGARLAGRKLFVPQAAGVDAFLVTAREAEGISLWLVPREAAGVALATETMIDGGNTGTLALDGVVLGAEARILAPARAPALLARTLDEAVIATAAALLGLMDRAFAITLDYLRTRTQFGKPIGSFQALQHRAADLLVQIELGRAAIGQAARLADDPAIPAPARAAAASQAKARASDAALLVTRQAVQMHGAIGYTDEHDIGLFLRRAMVLSARYGNAALHRRRHAALAPAIDTEE